MRLRNRTEDKARAMKGLDLRMGEKVEDDRKESEEREGWIWGRMLGA